jgi:magnesium transporter
VRDNVVVNKDPVFEWVDVVAPEPAELRQIATEFGFHAMSVEDCLDPWHLPKFERFGETTFVILRVFDQQCSSRAASVQEITRKIAVFFRPGLVVTIHRADLALVASARDRFRQGNGGHLSDTVLLGTLFNGALDSFDAPLDQAEDMVDALEEDLLSPARRSPDLQAIHLLKRRVNVIKRLFWQTNSVLQKLVMPGDRATPVFHDVKENAESYYYYADQLLDEINNLLGIHVALSSHRTNEVMRVLTVFSAFFLPLTFIVGVYGMNFDFMPELRVRWGYPAVLGLMLGVCGAIAWWFHRRGWLGRGKA